MAKRFSKTRDELRIKVMSRCLSAPDATSLHQLQQEQAAKTDMLSVVSMEYISAI